MIFCVHAKYIWVNDLICRMASKIIKLIHLINSVDLLIAVFNRKSDAIDNGFLLSFFMKDYLQAYTAVVRAARDIDEV